MTPLLLDPPPLVVGPVLCCAPAAAEERVPPSNGASISPLLLAASQVQLDPGLSAERILVASQPCSPLVPTGGPHHCWLRATPIGRYLRGYMLYIQGRTVLDPLEQCQGHGFPLNPQGIPLLFPRRRPLDPLWLPAIQDFPLPLSFFILSSCVSGRLAYPGTTVAVYLTVKQPHHDDNIPPFLPSCASPLQPPSILCVGPNPRRTSSLVDTLSSLTSDSV